MNASLHNRRKFLRGVGLGGVLFAVPGAFAQQLVLTPAQTLGPYYPDRLPLDRDNDLIIISDNITPAIGEITWLSGRVLDQRGQPVRGATVEIWQADNNGAYIHTQSPIGNRDGNFQGYGRFVTGSTGEYLFRTVKPGLYPGRTRHIHFQM
jgi:protocatechuate 3,4-dioxygenase beta subunit